MLGIPGFLQWRTLTETAQTFRFPRYRLREMWRGVETDLDGLTAKWDVYAPTDDLDNEVVDPGDQAKKLNLAKRGTEHSETFMQFWYKDFPAEMLPNMRDLGQNMRADQRVKRYVARELELMGFRASIFDERMISSMLGGGQLSIEIGGKTLSVDYSIPSANKNSAGTAWSDASADVAGDVEAQLQLLEQIGYDGAIAITTRKVFNALRKNTTVKDYLSRASVGLDVVTRGEIPDLFGLQWLRYDLTHLASGSRTRFLPEGYLIIIPEPDRTWTEFQLGLVAIGEKETGEGIPEFDMVNGPAAWFSAEDNPPSFRQYYRYARLPVLKVPGAVIYFNTGVT